MKFIFKISRVGAKMSQKSCGATFAAASQALKCAQNRKIQIRPGKFASGVLSEAIF